MRVKETCFSETLAYSHQITSCHFVVDNKLTNVLIDVHFSNCIKWTLVMLFWTTLFIAHISQRRW